MGQRHNRRRTRPRSSLHSNIRQDYLSSSISPATSHSTACIQRGTPVPIPAPTWHYGYSAWQIRETKPQLQLGGLEDEQYRLFGGEPGDDVTLCYRMLEYFGGLDYIHP
ncbi:hypothetical protein N7454_009295 [Penicillium verhagenii]|nr:hypothetical protein N7454_009295 [Penicillium verhagenii]